MIFADTDAQYLLNHFGSTGLALLFTAWLMTCLMQIWIAFRTNAHLDSLRRATERDSIRFSKLHEQRAEIIKTLYGKLLALSETGMLYVTEGTNDNKLNFVRGMMDFGAYYKTNKIYFSDKVCDKMEEVTQLMFTAIGSKFAYPHREKEMSNSDKLIRDFNVLLAVSPDILAELEREFRELLGVEVDPKRKIKPPQFINAKEMKKAIAEIKRTSS